jgi:hypothetical protein
MSPGRKKRMKISWCRRRIKETKTENELKKKREERRKKGEVSKRVK